MTDVDPKRIQLQTLLESLLGSDQVYFQSPTNAQMKYPAIVYYCETFDTKFADNRPYLLSKGYQVTVISRQPDSDIPKKIAALPLCSFSREFTADNLYHSVFLLYF